MSGGGAEFDRDFVVIGGGAAGYFAAITAAETRPGLRVTIFEKGRRPLAKVAISGGGRCNVTHACFEPRDLVARYPRGQRELRGPFHAFGPRDTVAWFESRGVALKTEADGRMFPTTDRSATIIDTLERAAQLARVRVELRCGVRAIAAGPDGVGFALELDDGTTCSARRVMVAVGGLKTGGMTEVLRGLGHTITPLAPSLFTFHARDPRLDGMSGVSVASVGVCVPEVKKLGESGPLLVTHWGLSGPAILKTSALGARALQTVDYHFTCEVNWAGSRTRHQVLESLRAEKQAHGKRQVTTHSLFDLPHRLWERLGVAAGVAPGTTWSQLPRGPLEALAEQITAARFPVTGKSMNKEEFVTCGGVALREVDFKTMESRLVPGLHFGGEVLDIDAVTGGFNFQAAWTTGYLTGQAVAAAAD